MRDTTTGMRVADLGSPDIPGTVVTSGPYVSEVKWDAPHDRERGKLQYVTNDFLVVVTNKPQPEP